MSANRVTMRDVAKEAGVTSAAVSYALSGKRPISEETRRRVEQAIERLGYTPNMAARTLGSARQDSRLIGVVVPQTEAGSRLMFQNQFYSEILGSIELCARQKGYHVIISATDANESYLTLAKERNLDGIIVIGMYPDSFYQQMKESRIPIVLIDSYCNDHYYHISRPMPLLTATALTRSKAAALSMRMARPTKRSMLPFLALLQTRRPL
ncbi:MAG: LacI family DNA-binding transcriptional regulator [Flavonifractor plautii]